MTETRWLDPEEREAWINLAAVVFTLPSTLESQLQRDADLTLADYMVLTMLSEQDTGPMRMSDLAASSSTSQSRLSRIVTRLENNGYVTRMMCPDDRRSVLAELTDAGLAKLAAAAPGHIHAVRAAVFDRLSREQIAQLVAIGKALRDDSCEH